MKNEGIPDDSGHITTRFDAGTDKVKVVHDKDGNWVETTWDSGERSEMDKKYKKLKDDLGHYERTLVIVLRQKEDLQMNPINDDDKKELENKMYQNQYEESRLNKIIAEIKDEIEAMQNKAVSEGGDLEFTYKLDI